MKIVKLLAVVIVALVLTSVTIANRAVDDSQAVAALSRDVAALSRDNTTLRASVAEAGSLTAASPAIMAAGFSDSRQIAAIAVRSPVALAK